jgi:cellulose biosynthesis protein BcsQ
MAETLRVVVTGRKGGIGKTTLAISIARGVAQRGARVLLLDLDAQRVGASWLCGAEVGSPLRYSAIDLIKGPEGRTFAPQTVLPGLDVIPANQRDLAGFEMQLVMAHQQRKLTMGPNPRRGALAARLAAVQLGYDFVVIDTPTAFGEVTTSALEAADLVIAPIDCSASANADSILDLDEHMLELSRKPPVCVVLNKFARKEKESRDCLARVQELAGPRFLEQATLPKCVEVARAVSAHRDIAGDTDSAAEFKNHLWMLVEFIINFAGHAAAVGGA